jgi:hypothetical protein
MASAMPVEPDKQALQDAEKLAVAFDFGWRSASALR